MTIDEERDLGGGILRRDLECSAQCLSVYENASEALVTIGRTIT